MEKLKKFLLISTICYFIFWSLLALISPWVLLIPLFSNIFFFMFFPPLIGCSLISLIFLNFPKINKENWKQRVESLAKEAIEILQEKADNGDISFSFLVETLSLYLRKTIAGIRTFYWIDGELVFRLFKLSGELRVVQFKMRFRRFEEKNKLKDPAIKEIAAQLTNDAIRDLKEEAIEHNEYLSFLSLFGILKDRLRKTIIGTQTSCGMASGISADLSRLDQILEKLDKAEGEEDSMTMTPRFQRI